MKVKVSLLSQEIAYCAIHCLLDIKSLQSLMFLQD